jgi:tRNA dimethylallyltransferase
MGPTAVGKSKVGLDLAEELGGEILSADSRQVYTRLTIGTAKPSPAELERVPHHFVDELALTEPFSAGEFAEAATQRIGDVLGLGAVPIVVGGSTLYIEALLHGLSDIPPTSPETRERLMQRLEKEGADRLYRELQRTDPASAATMDPSKTQRVVRALEVYEDTGHTLSSYHTHRSGAPFPFAPFVLTRPRPILYERINRRVDRMLDAGLVEENRRLLDTQAELNPLRTIGYREPMAFLRGDIGYDEMVRLLKRNSRRYAKRQLTWFRRREEYRWIDLEEELDVASLVRSVCSLG